MGDFRSRKISLVEIHLPTRAPAIECIFGGEFAVNVTMTVCYKVGFVSCHSFCLKSRKETVTAVLRSRTEVHLVV